MEALKFFEEKRRMCNSYTSCVECKLFGVCREAGCMSSAQEDENILKIVEEWSKEHPKKTRQSEFLKTFPSAKIGKDGVLDIGPCKLVADLRNSYCVDCDECRKRYWLKELE